MGLCLCPGRQGSMHRGEGWPPITQPKAKGRQHLSLSFLKNDSKEKVFSLANHHVCVDKRGWGAREVVVTPFPIRQNGFCHCSRAGPSWAGWGGSWPRGSTPRPLHSPTSLPFPSALWPTSPSS